MEVPTADQVTFLFTDMEGSTRLWEQHPGPMAEALTRHDALLGELIARHGGRVFKWVGDACCAAFADPLDAVRAAVAGQLALTAEAWPEPLTIRVRMAIHRGEAVVGDGDYFGRPLNRTARLLGTAHGGQTVVSGAVRQAIEDRLPDDCSLDYLGEHYLRDLEYPESVSQVNHPDLPASFPPLRSLQTLRHNLPHQLSSFIGREAEVAQIAASLSANRLVTLVGSGGCGKSRLAVQVGAEWLSADSDGVWLVELASLNDPVLVAQTVATALGVTQRSAREWHAELLDYLRRRRLLLILDNCEHLLDAVAELAEQILRQCPQVIILATSRESLALAGETTIRVASLAVPPMDGDPAALAENEAVRLFITRAGEALPGFALMAENVAAVTEICRRLDGLPLALELAAARVRSMTPGQIAQRLDERFKLLTGGSRTALPRQRTLQAAVDWSYQLLGEDEQVVLQEASVFVGGWTLEQAEAVCGGERLGPWEVADALTALVDRSMAQFDPIAGRYSLLETIRHYAAERLLETGSQAVRDRHLAWFANLAERAYAHRSRPAAREWLARLETDRANLRAALDWCSARPEHPGAGLRLAGHLYWFWDLKGYWAEGRAQLEAALARGAEDCPDRDQILARQGAGLLTMHLDDLDAAERWDRLGLELCEQLGDRVAYCRLRHNLGRVAQRREDLTTATELIAASLAEQRGLDDPEGLAISLHSLGNLRSLQGDQDQARELLEESLELLRTQGDLGGAAYCLSSLGTVAQLKGDLEAAPRMHEQSLALQHELGDKRGQMFSLANLGVALHAREDNQAAERCYEEGHLLSVELGDGQSSAVFLVNLGALLIERGALDEAAERLESCLALCEESGVRRLTAYCLRNLGALARRRGQRDAARRRYLESLAVRREIGDRLGYAELWESLATLSEPDLAARLMGAADALREELGLPLTDGQARDLETALAPARAALGDATWAAAVVGGRALAEHEVFALVG